MLTQQHLQKQQLKLLPQQIELLNLYLLNTEELQQRIVAELNENPFLDVTEPCTDAEQNADAPDEVEDFRDWDEQAYDDRPDYKAEYANYFDAEVAPNVALADEPGLKEMAKQQLALLDLPPMDAAIVAYLIDILNANGMMDRGIEEAADEFSFQVRVIIDPADILRGLHILQTLEPVGIGARNVRECMLLQLQTLDQHRADVAIATRLLEAHFDKLLHRQFEKLHHDMAINDDELKAALLLLGRLNFKPYTEPAGLRQKNTILPDFYISKTDSGVVVQLTSRKSDAMQVNHALFDELNNQISAKDHSAAAYARNKLSGAQWFVNAVKQRESTMLLIMNSIVSLQRDYFAEGDVRVLKPMVLRNIAEITQLDLSTVCRITGNKYAETHFGTIYLKDLFSEGITDQKGEHISNKAIQAAIANTVQDEDKKHPLTDQQLVTLLQEQGYNIARRTVSKYRDILHIATAQIRAVWA